MNCNIYTCMIYFLVHTCTHSLPSLISGGRSRSGKTGSGQSRREKSHQSGQMVMMKRGKRRKK